MRRITVSWGRRDASSSPPRWWRPGSTSTPAVLITEAAPWPSVIQRAGRCNRAGRVGDGELWWVSPPSRIHTSRRTWRRPVNSAGWRPRGNWRKPGSRNVPVAETPVTVLRRNDLVSLFDTAPDLSGADLDIAPYVRDADDLDVQLAWATWVRTRVGSGRRTGRLRLPTPGPRQPSSAAGCRSAAGRPDEARGQRLAPGPGSRPLEPGDAAGQSPAGRGPAGRRGRRRL